MRKMPEKRKINSFVKIIINKFEILTNELHEKYLSENQLKLLDQKPIEFAVEEPF